VRLVWSRSLPAAPLGLGLAREAGTLLLWDVDHHLGRYDRQGQGELRQRAPGSLVAAALSDDGLTVAAAGKRGQAWLLNVDLVPVWERSVPRRPVALALDALGRRLAVADEGGGLHVFDRAGQVVWRAAAARPLAYLAFVPEAPALVGSADFGLVCAFDRAGRCLWRDGLVAHVGSLAVSADGGRVVLACFTDGLCCYALTQPRQARLPRAAPSRLAAIDYKGELLLTAGLGNELALRGGDGEVRAVLAMPSSPVAVAVEALGDSAVAALAGGMLARVELGP
jgi:hypothetical protein